MRWAVDDVLERVADNHVRVVNANGPQIDKDKEAEIGHAMQGEEVGENMVGQGLRVTVEWVESVRSPRGGNDPSMVWLVNVLVHGWPVLDAVYPVDGKVGKPEEEG